MESVESQEVARRTTSHVSAQYVPGMKSARGTPYLYNTILFLSEIFELRNAEADETKAERPFGLKKFFASIV